MALTERLATSATVATSTWVLNPASTLSVGTSQVLIFTANNGKLVSSLSDSKGNTWTVDYAVSPDTNRSISVCSCASITTAVTSSDTVTLALSNTTSNECHCWIEEPSSALSGVDQTHSSSGASTAPSSGASSTLAQTDEFAFGVVETNGALGSWTAGSGWSSPTTATLGSASGSALEWQETAANSALTANGTLGNSRSWAAAVVTYKVAGAAQPDMVIVVQ